MCSPQILARAFSRAALERYVPRLQGALRREVRSWCAARGPVAVYEAAKALTFRMAARILLGLRLDEAQCSELARIFEQFVENLFSLPLDVPFSGLRKVLPPRQPQTFPSRLPWCAIGIASAGSRRFCPVWGGGMVAVGFGAGLCPDLLCELGRATHPLWTTPGGTSSSPSSRGFPDVGSRWQETSQSPRPLPRAAPPGSACSASLEAPWLGNGWERKGRRHAPGPGRRQPGLERGGCRLTARGPRPASFRIREPWPLQTSEQWAGLREQLIWGFLLCQCPGFHSPN